MLYGVISSINDHCLRIIHGCAKLSGGIGFSRIRAGLRKQEKFLSTIDGNILIRVLSVGRIQMDVYTLRNFHCYAVHIIRIQSNIRCTLFTIGRIEVSSSLCFTERNFRTFDQMCFCKIENRLCKINTILFSLFARQLLISIVRIVQRKCSSNNGFFLSHTSKRTFAESLTALSIVENCTGKVVIKWISNTGVGISIMIRRMFFLLHTESSLIIDDKNRNRSTTVMCKSHCADCYFFAFSSGS